MTLPRFGVHTFGFVWKSDAQKAVEALIENGVSTLQLMATPPHYDPWRISPDRQRRLRATIDAAGVEILALDLASSDVNLASPAPEVVDFAVNAYLAAIERAAELGARWICVGSGRRHALAPEVSDRLLDIYRGAFELIVGAAGRRGISVILENHPHGVLADAPAIEEFLAKGGHENVAVVYDVANACAIGEDPVLGLERLLPRIGIVHLSDAPRGQWRHDPIGSGDIDFAAIRDRLASFGYAGAVVLEVIARDPLEATLAGRAALLRGGWRFSQDRPASTRNEDHS